LTDNGRRLAQRMRPVLGTNKFRLVLCSPMRRARETCELAGLGDQAVTDADLADWELWRVRGADAQADPRGDARLAPFPAWMPGWRGSRTGRCTSGPGESAGAHGQWRCRALRARTFVARARRALDRFAGKWGPTFSPEHGDSMCARLLPGNTRRAYLERASLQLGH
jgi:broad specificity phosphatase PhoE